jgi:hypothetical protein
VVLILHASIRDVRRIRFGRSYIATSDKQHAAGGKYGHQYKESGRFHSFSLGVNLVGVNLVGVNQVGVNQVGGRD